MTNIAPSIIRFGFYILFFLVPLVFYSGSFELFEYNKMMLTYAFTIIIVSAWIIKIIIEHRPVWSQIKRTPFDLPIVLYLISHLISTFLSLDTHTSIWGYYSRFHEGLLASISYILLFYAAVSNLDKRDVSRIFIFSFLSGILVSVWGALEHFGHSPSCLAITGKFDVDCWIQDVKSRVFATLGQPNWMAAYLDALILIALGYVLSIKKNLKFLLLIPLFFSALLFTKSRSGILGLIIGLGTFGLATLITHRRNLQALILNRGLILSVALISATVLIFGLPFAGLEKFTVSSLLSSSPSITKGPESSPAAPIKLSGPIDAYESGDIRKIVWKGAIKIWQRHPIFGSGVETFAHAYYLDRPVEHNLVSEWDFLYNKAHNEFLNILATTGTVGMLAYLSLIVAYAWWNIKNLLTSDSNNSFILAALFAAYISILVTNFFGFSVVIVALFFFLSPAFSLILKNPQTETLQPVKAKSAHHQHEPSISLSQWIIVSVISALSLLMLWNLTNMWLADKSFAYGKNLDGVSEYASAYPYLSEAVNRNPDEPTFRDELAYNEAILAGALFNQASGSAREKLTTPYGGSEISAETFVQKAIFDSNKVVETSPNILAFWKTRTKIFHQLSAIDGKYRSEAIRSIKKAASLAPTDAKVHYNLGLLLGQSGQLNEAIQIMAKTVKMKPDYPDARYALGLFYSEAGQKQKASEQMQYILDHIASKDERATKWLEENK